MGLFIYRDHSIGFVFFKSYYIGFDVYSTNTNFFKFCDLAHTMFWIYNIIFYFKFSFFSILFFYFFNFRLIFIIFTYSKIVSFFRRVYWRLSYFFLLILSFENLLHLSICQSHVELSYHHQDATFPYGHYNNPH